MESIGLCPWQNRPRACCKMDRGEELYPGDTSRRPGHSPLVEPIILVLHGAPSRSFSCTVMAPLLPFLQPQDCHLCWKSFLSTFPSLLGRLWAGGPQPCSLPGTGSGTGNGQGVRNKQSPSMFLVFFQPLLPWVSGSPGTLVCQAPAQPRRLGENCTLCPCQPGMVPGCLCLPRCLGPGCPKGC